MNKRIALLRYLWRGLNGDNAYERYLSHWWLHHAESGSRPLTRKDFFTAEIQRKWNGVRRCC